MLATISHYKTWHWNAKKGKLKREQGEIHCCCQSLSNFVTTKSTSHEKNTISRVPFEGSICLDQLFLQTGKQTTIQSNTRPFWIIQHNFGCGHQFRGLEPGQSGRAALCCVALPSQALPSGVGMKPMSHSQRKPPGRFKQWPLSHRLLFSAHSSLSVVVITHTRTVRKHAMHSCVF